MKQPLQVRIIRSKRREGGSYFLIQPSGRGETCLFHVCENPSDTHGLVPTYTEGTLEDFKRLVAEKFGIDTDALECNSWII